MKIKGTGGSGHSFSQVPNAEIPRSSFDRSHGLKTTFDAGFLVPIFLDEALPGDTFNLRMTGFARMATPIFPIMDNMYMETFFFAVPHRLIWENWERFCGSQDNPDDSTDFVIPQMVTPPFSTDPDPEHVEGFAFDTLADYFGLPLTVPNVGASALPFRAFRLIWNEWFRDQNLQDSLAVPLDDGPDPWEQGELMLRRGKRHDYFTSCLPWPQKGDSVDLPLGLSAPVSGGTITGLGAAEPTFNVQGGSAINDENLWASLGSQNIGMSVASDATAHLQWEDPALQVTGQTVDLSTATAATINQLRQAFQIQKLLERDARGGTRYTEVVRAHFGVTSPDARLQRPEYLGGGRSNVTVSAVAQTSATEAATPQGNLSAFATATLSGHGFTKSFTEHCVIIGMVCVRADLTYQHRLERMWSRQTKYDFYWPALAHIGEQAVLRKEIYHSGVVLQDDAVFGYQERFAEYRYKPSMITGLFRSNHPASLDAWHLAQDFVESGAPVLNAEFIQEAPPVDRVIAVPAEPHFLFDSYFQLRCARPMPMFGVPGLIDHF